MRACRQQSSLYQFDRHRRRFAAADAQGRHAALAAGFLQGAQQGDDGARARGADRVAQRARAAVDVDLAVRNVEVVHGGHRHGGERFIDLEQVHLAAAPACFRVQFLDGADGSRGELVRRLRVRGVAVDLGDDGAAELFAVDSRISTRAAAPSLIDEDEAAVMVPSFLKAGFSDGIFSRRAFCGPSSRLMTVSPPRPETVTGAISHSKLPSLLAAWARLTDSMANASCASRVNAYWLAHSSANVPIERALPFSSQLYASSRPSIIIWS